MASWDDIAESWTRHVFPKLPISENGDRIFEEDEDDSPSESLSSL